LSGLFEVFYICIIGIAKTLLFLVELKLGDLVDPEGFVLNQK